MTPDGMAILHALAPEVILTAGAMFILLTGLIRGVTGHAAFNLAFLVVVAALVWCVQFQGGDAESGVGRYLLADSLVSYARSATLGIGLLILLACRGVPEPRERAEFFCLLLLSLAGISLVTVANDLILLFLALELVSVPTYVLIGLSRRDIRAQEATGKYFFLGAFAAAIMLYGFSFLYGGAGTMQLFAADGASDSPSIAACLALPSRGADKMLALGLLLSLAGLTFKIAAVPLHFYVADVYQGAASPVTGMLGFVPKFAGFLAMIRLLSMTGWSFGDGLFWLLWALAAATMMVGNTLALMQQNVKRMLAYSSVAHSGYMLVALLVGSGSAADATTTAGPLSNGLAALLFYMVVYGVMNLGAFAALSFFRKAGAGEEDSAETLDDLAGAARRHPWACLAMAVCVLGLMGMPPTGGFFGKLYIFSAALSAPADAARQTALLWLVIFGVLNAAVAAAYYLRILAACYLRTAGEAARGVAGSPDYALRACLAACAVAVLMAFARPALLIDRSRSAVDGSPNDGWQVDRGRDAKVISDRERINSTGTATDSR